MNESAKARGKESLVDQEWFDEGFFHFTREARPHGTAADGHSLARNNKALAGADRVELCVASTGLVAGTCVAQSGNVVTSVEVDRDEIDLLTRRDIPIYAWSERARRAQ